MNRILAKLNKELESASEHQSQVRLVIAELVFKARTVGFRLVDENHAKFLLWYTVLESYAFGCSRELLTVLYQTPVEGDRYTFVIDGPNGRLCIDVEPACGDPGFEERRRQRSRAEVGQYMAIASSQLGDMSSITDAIHLVLRGLVLPKNLGTFLLVAALC